MLKNKKILLAVSGSIAAYKTAIIVRLFIKEGAEVKVIMTEAATDFISPLTLSTLSKNSVHSSVSNEDSWNNHVELGLWADVMIVAPATANTLAAMANGICNNMLLAAYLSARCPVFFAPAMDLDMWVHPATQSNINKLISYGNQMIDVADGELASGLFGKGRMAEPEEIVQVISKYFESKSIQNFKGKKVLITSGPTVEAIDPVRFISNHSTGKMGKAIAEELASQGAEITFISGPVNEYPRSEKMNLVKVKSAEEMYQAALLNFSEADIVILTAAVADYRPAVTASEKIKKKGDDGMNIELIKTKDIAAELGKIKKGNQIFVGFALETENVKENAQKKLSSKNLDFVVLNNLKDQGAGFGYDTNKITIIDKYGNSEEFSLKSKKEVAFDIAHKILDITNNK
jgi:phosphopantothenoylcysteine decarboxylase / phosphopantothenate---cysteine ligase